jgi:hypothetical protein
MTATAQDSTVHTSLAEVQRREAHIPQPRAAAPIEIETPTATPTETLSPAAQRARRDVECEAHRARLKAARETTQALELARELPSIPAQRSETVCPH